MNESTEIKSALVTGASRGIGKAIALSLAKRGFVVAVHYKQHPQEAQSVLEEIHAMGGKAYAFQADLASREEVMALTESAWEKLESIHVLVNNAGVSYKKHFLDQTPEDVDLFLNVNVKGTLYLTQEIAKRMVAHNLAGSIYTLTSVNALQPSVGHSVYGASKGALETLMKGVALELAPHRIRVNTLVVGAIKTDMNKLVWTDNEKLQHVEAHIPFNRLGEPVEVAELLAHLVDHDAYMTGSSIKIDGGWLLNTGFEIPKRYDSNKE